MRIDVELHPEMTVNEVIGRAPESVAVFREFGIDACCGGDLAVVEAARRHEIPLDRLLAALAAGTGTKSAGAGT